jgi:hypothetical protein
MRNFCLKLIITICLIVMLLNGIQSQVLVEAESFSEKGGWVVDQQFMDQMGSPYLMAHGLGEPVKDAKTMVNLSSTGKYRVFVRTFNWTALWYKSEGPGKFSLLVDGKPVSLALGASGEKWMWQDAGVIAVNKPIVEIALHDQTGFNGRCDAILFTSDPGFVPPSDPSSLSSFRKKLTGFQKPAEMAYYDFVVTGGGVAGICAAVSAARLGLRVALIHDRPVLGGNNSSEVRVGLSGDIDKNLYPNIGNVLKKINPVRPPNAGPPEAFLDLEKEALVSSEKNISLFLKMHVSQVEKDKNRIVAVIATDIETGEEYRFSGNYFADCTGDGTIGFLAGADYRMGRESAYEAFESMAPVIGDGMTMGTSNLWSSKKTDSPTSFPDLPWAVRFSDEYYLDEEVGDWRWESGFNKNTITDAENIRDLNLRAVFGNWSYLKNHVEKYKNHKLEWVAYIGGKRESRRLLGDIILNENDIQNQIRYPDESVTTTWSLDLHFPDEINSRFFKGEEFYSWYTHPKIYPYHIPYRCFYSRNINNLFMAGRNISVTHVALGTVRVQRTTAMMGEVIGMAVSVCMKNNALPRDVYLKYWDEMKKLMKEGIPEK